MNTVSKAALVSASLVAVSLLGMAHPALAAGPSIDDELLRMQGEFELGNGDKVLVHAGHKPASYRVCVKDVPGVVPLKVIVDGKDSVVGDGTCENVTGKHIDVTPAVIMKGDEVLIGRFERAK